MINEVENYITPRVFTAMCEDFNKIITSKNYEELHAFHKRLKRYKWKAFHIENRTYDKRYINKYTTASFNLCHKCYIKRLNKEKLEALK